MKQAILIVGVLFTFSLNAQTYVNPFEDNKNQFNQQDIIVLWNAPGADSLNQRVFGYDIFAELAGQTSDLVQPFIPKQHIDNVTIDNGQYVAVAVGNFDGDKYEDIFYLLENGSGWQCALTTMGTEFDPNDTTYSYELMDPTSYLTVSTSSTNGYPQMELGDVDGDGTDEVVIAWWESTGDLVHIQILDSDNGSQLNQRASISDQISLRVNNSKDAYDISCGDLNGDGSDEIILMGMENSGSGNANYQSFVKVYEVNNLGSNTITPQGYLVVDDEHIADDIQNNYQVGHAQNAVSAMLTRPDTMSNQAEDIFASFAFVYYGQQQINYDNFFHYLIRSSTDLSTLTIIDTLWSHLSIGQFDIDYPIESKAGDMNGDRIDDVVLVTSSSKIYTVINDTIQFKINGGGPSFDENNSGILESVERVELGDIDQDGREEIIVFSKGFDGFDEHNFSLSLWGVDENFDYDTLGGGGYSFSDNTSGAMRSYAIAIGNLDGSDFSLGTPSVQYCEYVQPVYMLGAIPSHFDIIDGVEYDVNGCYPVQDCDLAVQIKNSQTSSTESTIEIKSDWAVSSETQYGVEVEGFSTSTTVSAKYGVNFEDINTQTNSQTISVTVTASADDMIQYTKIPLSVWEYPVLNGAGDTTNFLLAVFPENNLSPQSIVANGKSLFNFTPDYEVGNILSYPIESSSYGSVQGLPQTSGSWIVLDDANVPSYEMSSSGSIFWELTSSSGLDWSSSAGAYAAVNTGVSTLGFGLGLPEGEDGTEYLEAAGLPANYPPNAVDESILQLYSSSISTDTEFEITPTNVIGAPNEFHYTISPKIYWNTEGSGTVTFDLDMNSNLSSGSFWSVAYTDKTDPALNLPYRYDLVHNPNLTNTTNLDRTKSLRFSTPVAQIGDTLSVFVKTFNYSFVATGGPVEFKLYHEHPDLGGTPISDINGNTVFTTALGMGERGRVETEVQFVMTGAIALDDFAKIYVELDPNDLLDEIHEENNLGWAQFGYWCNEPGLAVSVQEFEQLDTEDLIKVYPVPANDQVIIEHDLRGWGARNAHVSVMNMLGEEVDRFNISTTYEGKIFWNTRSISPGIYLISIYDEYGIKASKKAIISK